MPGDRASTLDPVQDRVGSMSLFPNLDNQGFLVVNGTRGIMPTLILSAARRHATIVYTVDPQDERAAEQLAQQIAAAGLSSQVSFIVTNLADEEDIDQLYDVALERLPSLDVLIHNLESRAVWEQRRLVDISLDEWNGVLKTELRLPFMLSQKAVEEYLCAGTPGRIVFVAYSGCGSGAFTSAQTGLRALARCINKEFGRREIGCNAVIVHAKDMMNGQSPVYPDGHVASDLVDTVLFLGSQESSFVNGEMLDIEVQRWNGGSDMGDEDHA